MKNRDKLFTVTALGAALLAAGCTTIPSGPSHMALPGTGKPFEQFRADDGACRQYASETIGPNTPARAQEEAAVKSTVAGAAIGALIGAAAGIATAFVLAALVVDVVSVTANVVATGSSLANPPLVLDVDWIACAGLLAAFAILTASLLALRTHAAPARGR